MKPERVLESCPPLTKGYVISYKPPLRVMMRCIARVREKNANKGFMKNGRELMLVTFEMGVGGQTEGNDVMSTRRDHLLSNPSNDGKRYICI